MTAAEPTILATSGGLVPSRRLRWEVGPLTDYAVELAGVSGRAPRVCFLATAMGDSSDQIKNFYDAAVRRGFAPSHLALFPMPNVDDPRELLLSQDVIWVYGGSVAGLLAMWRLHGIDLAMREAWQAGVVLTGVSAGSICWHSGGTTDSFGPLLRPVTDGLALVPFSNTVRVFGTTDITGSKYVDASHTGLNVPPWIDPEAKLSVVSFGNTALESCNGDFQHQIRRAVYG